MTAKEWNLRCRDYLVAHRKENQQGGEKMLAYLSSNRIRAEGGPVRGLYIPKILPAKTVQVLKEAGETMERICEKAIRFYWENEDFRKCFAFPPALEKLVLADPGYRTLLPILRVDIFLDEETDGFKFCELNTDGTSGMIEDRELYHAFTKTPLYQELSRSTGLHNYELFETLAGRYLEILEEKEAGQSARYHGPGHDTWHFGPPSIAIVDFLEYASSLDEFEEYRRSFEKLGAKAVISDIRSLTFDGERLRTEDGTAIDAVYRRAVTSDIMAHPSEAKALTDACLAGCVTLLGGFCTQVVHDKAFFPAVAGPLADAFLTKDERAFLQEHLPTTEILNNDTLRKYVPDQNKEHWILKPRSSYGSRGVFIGKETKQEDWETYLAEFAAGSSYLLQEFVAPYKSQNIDYASDQPVLQDYFNTTGIYVFGGTFAGVYSRASTKTIITTSNGGFDLTTVEAR